MEDKREDLQITSMTDPQARMEASKAPEGVHPFYHVIGKLGGQSVRDHYQNFGKN